MNRRLEGVADSSYLFIMISAQFYEYSGCHDDARITDQALAPEKLLGTGWKLGAISQPLALYVQTFAEGYLPADTAQHNRIEKSRERASDNNRSFLFISLDSSKIPMTQVNGISSVNDSGTNGSVEWYCWRQQQMTSARAP